VPTGAVGLGGAAGHVKPARPKRRALDQGASALQTGQLGTQRMVLRIPGHYANGSGPSCGTNHGPRHSDAMAVICWDERDVGRWSLRAVVERRSLMVECGNCWRLVQVDARKLIVRFGPNTEVREVPEKMVCW
jgi:hypothetical protein